MDLNSLAFVLFLAVVCALSYICPQRLRYIWLLVCSYGFYLYSPTGWQQNLPALGLLVCATAVSWLCAFFMGKTQKLRVKRVLLVLSLLCCLGLLFACKYFDFFANGAEWSLRLLGSTRRIPRLNLVLPLGISYYTLQTVSYVADVYLGSITPDKNPLRYALYVSFFPGIVTGPINRAGEMLPQYKNPPPFNYDNVSGGLFRVLWGLFKKLVIADRLAVYTAAIFGAAAEYTGPELVLAALLFSYQLYCDFGGCCDIAIGAARMLGFTFKENFNRPFAAKTYSALWQRWHISLTSFLRDYVFTPLVWSRWTSHIPYFGKRWFQKPPIASSVLIIFTISGLWHGAAVGYVIWGVLNGSIMVVAKWLSKPKERLVKRIPLYRIKPVRGVFQRVFVYLMFTGCLVFFALSLFGTSLPVWLTALAGGWGAGQIPLSLAAAGLEGAILAGLCIAVLLIELVELRAVRGGGTIAGWVRRRRVFVRWPLYYLLLAGILTLGAFGQSSFIYQQY